MFFPSDSFSYNSSQAKALNIVKPPFPIISIILQDIKHLEIVVNSVISNSD